MTEKPSLFKIEPKELVQDFIAFLCVQVSKWGLNWWYWFRYKAQPKVADNVPAGFLFLLIWLVIIVANFWRNRRNHDRGKIPAGRLAIWVAEFEQDDRRGTHQTRVSDSLVQTYGKIVEVLRAGKELRRINTGNAAEDFRKANEKAQAFLVKYGGMLVVWGEVVIGQPTTIQLRLTSEKNVATNSWPGTYVDNILPVDIWLRCGLIEILPAVARQQILGSLKEQQTGANVLNDPQGMVQDPVAATLALVNYVGQSTLWALDSGAKNAGDMLNTGIKGANDVVNNIWKAFNG